MRAGEGNGPSVLTFPREVRRMTAGDNRKGPFQFREGSPQERRRLMEKRVGMQEKNRGPGAFSERGERL